MAQKRGGVIVDENVAHVTSVLAQQHEHALIDDTADLDATALAALGYKQEFKRDLSVLESFSVAFSILGLLPSIASTLTYCLGYSGTGGSIWGYLVSGIMIQATAFSMAELCSSMPTAGGLYYAAAVLAPEGWGPFCAWIVGWSNLLGFVSGPCSVNYALASMLVTAGEIAYPGYTAKNWHIFLILLGILVLQGIIGMQSTKVVGRVNVVGTIWNLGIIIIFVIWFPVGAINNPKFNDNEYVWTKFQNGTQWPIGWATIMGFLTAIYTMSGYDAPFHLSEECRNANKAGPRAIVMTSGLGLTLGWAIMLVIVYTVKDIPSVVDGQYGQPFGSLCLQVLGKKAGLAMFSLNMIAQFFVGQGCTVAASRIIFAYSRDGAILGSRYWRRVDKRTHTPVFATWGVLAFGALLGLLIFAGPVAIGAVFSIGAIGQYTSFTMPVFLKLFFSHGRFKPGPWNLGKLSRPINAVAVAWWCVILPALCFPAVKGKSLTLDYMNWTCVIYGGSMFLVILYYAIDGRKWFRGPKINIDHIHEGQEPVIDSRGSEEIGVAKKE